MHPLNSLCDIYLVRHGETDWNAEGRLQGHSDVSLNSAGYAQAIALRDQFSHLSFEAVFSSDLSRARQTAEVILHTRNIPLIESPILRERHFGPFQGRPVVEFDEWMKQFAPVIQTLSKEEYLSYRWHPEIETSAEVYQRFRHFLRSSIPYLGVAILIVSHGGVIRALLDHHHFALNHKWLIKNCAFIRIKANSEHFYLDEYHVGITRKEIN